MFRETLTQFYHFAVAVSERILVERRPAIDAVLLELQCFAELLEEKPLLGVERQLGLIGELIVLERLIAKHGADGLNAWGGPQREPHDFRLGTVELEVKTTIRPQRVHTIHGVEQLVPSDGCSLFLISVLLGPSGNGDGFSLADKVQKVSSLLASAPARLQQFVAALETCGFRDVDRAHYTRRFALRRPIAVIAVDESFPAITRSTIQSILGQLAPRLDAIQYDVNVEGLEQEDGTAGFVAIFPA